MIGVSAPSLQRAYGLPNIETLYMVCTCVHVHVLRMIVLYGMLFIYMYIPSLSIKCLQFFHPLLHLSDLVQDNLTADSSHCPLLLQRLIPITVLKLAVCTYAWIMQQLCDTRVCMFLYHPYIPSFKSKDFSFTCLLSFFFAAHCILL